MMRNVLLWVSVAAWVWCNLVVGPVFCGTAVEGAQNNLSYERLRFRITYQTTGNDYFKFITLVRDYLSSGSLSNDIPQLREPTLPVSDSHRFVLVELTNLGEETITLAIDMVNVYVVAYQAGDESFFLRDPPEGAHEQLFTSTTQYTLPFNGSYIDLQRHAEENRDQIPLGRAELIQAITGLRYSGGSNQVRASSLIVIIQMISEAARFNPILWRVRQHIDSGESFVPDTYMLNLETSWGSQSREVQQSIEGVFNSPIRLQIAHGDHFITLSNVRDVIASLALMLFKCRAPRPSSSTSSDHEQYPNYSLLLIRPVVPAEKSYDDVVNVDDDDDVTSCTISEPTVRIVGRNGLCVDVRDGKFHNGNPIQLWPCKSNDDANQLWTIKSDGTIRSNGRCMTAYGFSPGQYVMIFDCDTAVREATLWEIWNNGTIISPKSEVVLGSDSGSSGTTLTVQTNTYSAGQGWLASNDTAPREVTIYGFRDLCMEANIGDGRVWMETCASSNKPEQKWALYGDGSIRPKQNQDQCLTCENDSSLTVITIVSCSAGSSGQRWLFTNEWTILNLNNGLVMDVRASDPSLRQIIIYPSTGNPNQMWLALPA
ncbi:hypothetical protein J5N97_019726 [Dioscorea zingiberensis]|uniref:Ribosome-inactivating protein n=1 Tax=Dioscorea zingiberensis TaxID=325984 RepID=A0A9D5CEE0_9LILI|nr:hypothetical protein J5N97_019726 [Dioscorea zingiberensis]